MLNWVKSHLLLVNEMSLQTKNPLVNVHLLLRCGDVNHKEMCSALKQALYDNFNNVFEAHTAESIYGANDFCVAATAKIDPKNVKEFEAALRNIQINSRPPSKVQDVRVDIEIV